MKKAENIIDIIEEAALVGRGGAAFPVARKWQLVKTALKKQSQGYIVVNAAEGEPGVKKDAWLLDNEAESVIHGVDLAHRFLGVDKVEAIYFFLSKSYHRAYSKKIEAALAAKKFGAIKKKFHFFFKPEQPSYICGEETATLNIIEGKRAEPRLKPPFPTEKGLFNKPTLLHNVETFQNISLAQRGLYKGQRLYTLAGAVKHRGVFSLPAILSTEEVLRATGNYPDFDFFVITGGEVCGEVLRSDQLAAPVEGSGLVLVYDRKNTDGNKLLQRWLRFYEQESCGACSACREGSYRLRELHDTPGYDKEMFAALLDNLEESSLCGLGPSLPLTVKSYLENIQSDKA